MTLFNVDAIEDKRVLLIEIEEGSFVSERVDELKEELCDIVLDICYQKEKSKQFAWDIVGQTILSNLLKNNKNIIHYPKLVNSGGDFTYCGKKFEMCEKELEVNSSDYSERKRIC